MTDSDASDKMLNEMVRPLGVEILIIPAIELVDTEKGFVPLIDPVRFVSSLLNSQESLHKQRENYAAFFARARAGIIYDMYHLTLARYLQLNPLPPSMRIVHMAAQFGLCELTEQDTNTFIEVGSKAVMDIMRTIFVASGDTIPISPLARDNVLPPIIHVPTALKPQTPRLILCYFLVRTNAERLDELLAAHPMPDVEFHCFTAKPSTRRAASSARMRSSASSSRSSSRAARRDRLGRQRDGVGGGEPRGARADDPDGGARRAAPQCGRPRATSPTSSRRGPASRTAISGGSPSSTSKTPAHAARARTCANASPTSTPTGRRFSAACRPRSRSRPPPRSKGGSPTSLPRPSRSWRGS